MTNVTIKAGTVSEWQAEDAKVYAKIVEKNRDINVEVDWWGDEKKALVARMEEEGVTIDNTYFSGFCSQGDGACFVGAVSSKYLAKHGILDPDASGRLYRTGSLYNHENTVSLELFNTEADGEQVLEALRKEMRTYYRELEKEYERLTEEEGVVETLDAYGYLFDATGKLVG
jgi:hypothetical protein